MSLQSVAEQYFSKLNSMASRLHADMTETKLAYEDLWGTLKFDEQQQILSESVIKPEICLRYSSAETKPIEEKYAAKVIVDDNGLYYRDEHSAAFSFKTPSQRDLTVFSKSEEDIREKKPVVLPQKKQKETEEKPNIFEPESQPAILDNNEISQFFPKTGLDLLDNW